MIYGFHSVSAYIKNNPKAIEIIYINSKRHDKRQQDLIELANSQNIIVEMVNLDKLNSLSTKNTNHQGVIAVVKTQQQQTLEQLLTKISLQKSAIVLILDGITDPQNLGSIIRTADFFGIDGIIIPKDNSASPDNDTVIKVSSGGIHNVPVITVNNLNRAMDKLKAHEFWIAGTVLDDSAVSLFEFKPAHKLVWVMGSEGTGIRRLIKENCDYYVTIPLSGHTESLNVSVATGIVLSHSRNLIPK